VPKDIDGIDHGRDDAHTDRMAGVVGVWPAFVADTAVSVAVIAYGWRVARRKPV